MGRNGGGGGGGAAVILTIPSRYGADTKDLPDWRSTKTNVLMERIIMIISWRTPPPSEHYSVIVLWTPNS
jgi:hypothetical protein